MEKWVIDKTFEEFGFDQALNICFDAAKCEVENMVDERIYYYNMLNSIRDGYVPSEKFNYRIRWSTPKDIFDNRLI